MRINIHINSFIPAIYILVSALLLNLNYSLSSDEGIVLNGAWKLYNHQLIYKDFFSYIAPGSFYLVLLSFKILNPTYISAKLASLALQLVSVFFVYKISVEFTKNKNLSFAISWIWLLVSSATYPNINHNNYSTYLSTIPIYYIIKFTVSKKNYAIIICGFFCGLTTIFLQQKGIILAPFLIICAFTASKAGGIKYFLKTSAIFLISFALPLLSLLLVWNMQTLISNLIVWPYIHDFPYDPNLYLDLTIIAAFYVLAAYLYRAAKADRNLLMVLTLSQTALFLGMAKRLDIIHLGINSYIPIIFTCYFLLIAAKKLWTKQFGKLKYFLWVYSLFLIIIVLAFRIYPAYISYKIFQASLNTGGTIYAHPFLPEIYFEFKKADPYPYSFLYTKLHPKEAFAANLKILQEQKPTNIITDYKMVEVFNYDKNNQLDDYINNNYKIVKTLGDIDVWAQK